MLMLHNLIFIINVFISYHEHSKKPPSQILRSYTRSPLDFLLGQSIVLPKFSLFLQGYRPLVALRGQVGGRKLFAMVFCWILGLNPMLLNENEISIVKNSDMDISVLLFKIWYPVTNFFYIQGGKWKNHISIHNLSLLYIIYSNSSLLQNLI